ncbi:MAG: hypothetical protein ACREYE_02860 [Gammaproteobacteria bacterium]
MMELFSAEVAEPDEALLAMMGAVGSQIGQFIESQAGSPGGGRGPAAPIGEVAWTFDAIRRKTAQGPYGAVNHHRFPDDIAITAGDQRTRETTRGVRARHHENVAILFCDIKSSRAKASCARPDGFALPSNSVRSPGSGPAA